MDVLIARDQKGLYSRALAGEVANVSGVDIGVDEPFGADAVIDNDGSRDRRNRQRCNGANRAMGQTMTAALEWDYSDLAAAYGKRPDYAERAIDRMLATAGVGAGATACDVGAGVGHLTVKLVDRGLSVVAVEPNQAMRGRGRARTEGWPEVRWREGAGEDTGQPDRTYDLVTFGSSFNVTDYAAAPLRKRRAFSSHAAGSPACGTIVTSMIPSSRRSRR